MVGDLFILKRYSGYWQQFRYVLDRSLQGIAEVQMGKNAPHYTTIHRRIKQLDITMDGIHQMSNACNVNTHKQDPHRHNDELQEIYLSIDSSELKIHMSGQWIREKWNMMRPFLKIHFIINVKTLEIIDFKITKSDKGYAPQFTPLVNKTVKKIRKEYNNDIRIAGDGAYGTKNVYNTCGKLGYRICIQTA